MVAAVLQSRTLVRAKAPLAPFANTSVPLSPMDVAVGRYSFPLLYIFAAPDAPHEAFQHEKLRETLSDTLSVYPHLAGRVDPETDENRGTVNVRCNNAGAEFVPATCDGSLADFAPSATDSGARVNSSDMAQLPTGLMPQSSNPQAPAREQPLLIVQCTVFKCGGLAIALNINHRMLDGEGGFNFVEAWGAAYRGVSVPVPSHDRHLLFSRGGVATFPHAEYKNAASPPSPPFPDPIPKTKAKLFHFSAVELGKLKSDALGMEKLETVEPAPYVSTIDVLTALLVVLLSRARKAAGVDFSSSSIHLNTGINARRRLVPELPGRYAGNAIFNARSSHPATDVLDGQYPAAVALAAHRIRKAVLQMTDAYLRSAVEYVAATEPDPSAVTLAVDYFFGKDFLMPSWANLGLLDPDFGSGQAVYAGPPNFSVADGFVVVLNSARWARSEKGLSCYVSMEETAMTSFEEALGQWRTQIL
ncbi:transferase [Fimicolochytrium jonesii]|uniref:transferase n=1 Tax=Fimicolochytrium jonesii TaxID=1396493 RepID=UPI0022FF2B05|nr:transferase [Fimicolochytrium jonesii]KAI8820146.1 transferase [Fimicolochytrium jonesii]